MIKSSAFSNYTVHMHPEVNISFEEREHFSFFVYTIFDKHEPSPLKVWDRICNNFNHEFQSSLDRKTKVCNMFLHMCSRKKLRVLLLSFAALLILFIVPLSKSSLWTLSIRFISLHWLVMRFKDGTAYAALYMLIM